MPGLMAALSLFVGTAFAQAEGQEPSAIAEVGGAGSWGLKGGSSSGSSVAVETTPIENVLEIEGGVTSLFSRSQSFANTHC